MRRTTSGESSSSSSPPSTNPYSHSLEPLGDTPRPPTRPFPKSAGSASLPAAPSAISRSKSWESDDKRGRSGTKKTLGLTKLDVRDSASPFDDPLRSPSVSTTGHRNSIISSSATNETRSLPPTPDCNYGRRNSTRSTSSMSQSPTSPIGMYVPSTSRQRYSIASSSYAHTIGDLSTSSMPLLRHPTRGGDETSSTHGTDTASVAGGTNGGGGNLGWTNRYQGSSSSRVHLAESRASYHSDDGSSVHSYPPRPRQRTGSTWTTSDHGEVSRHSWTRDFELTGATGQVQRRGSADSRSDSWPAFVSNSYVHQPITRPTPAYLSQLSTYSFPPGPVNVSPPAKVAPPRAASSGRNSRGGVLGSSNPLAPLRKRLARSLAGSGGHLHTEVQLLLELVDALDHCITLFSSPSPPPADPIFSPVARSSPPSPTVPVPLDDDDDNDDSTTPSIGVNPSRGTTSTHAKIVLLDEVRLLVCELVELVPDAQRCLANGQYGPLALASVTTCRLVESLEEEGHIKPRRDRDRDRDRDEAGDEDEDDSPPRPRPPVDPTTTTSIVSPVRGPRTTRRPALWNSSNGRDPASSSSSTGPGPNRADWWPSRLARDCRNLLLEAGLPTGKGFSTVWLAARLSEEGGGGGGGGGGGTGGTDAESARRSASARSDGVRTSSSPTAPSRGTVVPVGVSEIGYALNVESFDDADGDDGGGLVDEQDEVVELREALSTTFIPTSRSAKGEAARRDELLEQGKKRWEAYRRKQMQRGPS